MIWRWCRSLFSIHVHGGSGYEWSCTCNISFIRHMYFVPLLLVRPEDIWMYGSFTSCYTQQLFTLGILCYNCKYRSISRDKIISNWSNNQPTLNDSRILTCLTWFMPLGSMYNVCDFNLTFSRWRTDLIFPRSARKAKKRSSTMTNLLTRRLK